ncbi:MAG: hypothetical protein AAFU54_18785 [Chloroflexota bacterium]
MATTTIAGFIGKVQKTMKYTKYGQRPVTTISVGVRPKGSNTTSWNYVNVWGRPDVKPGDVVRVNDVKTFGKTHYGKIAAHDPRNQRDRQQASPAETSDVPVQLQLF